MRILFLEPFAGPSHLAVAEGFARHSRHDVELFKLPDRFWKWRMRSAAIDFYHTIERPEDYDAIIASDIISVADLKGLWSGRTPPIVLYCHENQISYPTRTENEADLHFGFTSITSCLAADHVWFNSAFHQNAFLDALPAFLRRMPDRRPLWVPAAIAGKSRVVYPGIEIPQRRLDPSRRPAPGTPGGSAPPEAVGASPPDGARSRGGASVPLVLWNHRWEYDKQPEVFFAAVDKLVERGTEFELAVVGESRGAKPPVFAQARARHGDRIRLWGFCSERAAYEALLCQADVVVSCAIQENFGISVLEAAAAGALPVLPRRLSYPELFGADEAVFYDSDADLADAIEGALGLSLRRLSGQSNAGADRGADARPAVPGLQERAGGRARAFAWEERISDWDESLLRL